MIITSKGEGVRKPVLSLNSGRLRENSPFFFRSFVTKGNHISSLFVMNRTKKISISWKFIFEGKVLPDYSYVLMEKRLGSRVTVLIFL